MTILSFNKTGFFILSIEKYEFLISTLASLMKEELLGRASKNSYDIFSKSHPAINKNITVVLIYSQICAHLSVALVKKTFQCATS